MYSSPEVMKGQLYDSKSDIWGLGILCYELNFGETPWSDLRREEQMEKIKNVLIFLICFVLLGRTHDPQRNLSFYNDKTIKRFH